MTCPWPWWTVAGTSQLGASTGAPDRVRKWATSSSRWSQAATSARTAVVLAATFATTGDGLRWTITFAPSARTTGSAQATPRSAATGTAARAAAAETLKDTASAWHGPREWRRHISGTGHLSGGQRPGLHRGWRLERGRQSGSGGGEQQLQRHLDFAGQWRWHLPDCRELLRRH